MYTVDWNGIVDATDAYRNRIFAQMEIMNYDLEILNAFAFSNTHRMAILSNFGQMRVHEFCEIENRKKPKFLHCERSTEGKGMNLNF